MEEDIQLNLVQKVAVSLLWSTKWTKTFRKQGDIQVRDGDTHVKAFIDTGATYTVISGSQWKIFKWQGSEIPRVSMVARLVDTLERVTVF